MLISTIRCCVASETGHEPCAWAHSLLMPEQFQICSISSMKYSLGHGAISNKAHSSESISFGPALLDTNLSSCVQGCAHCQMGDADAEQSEMWMICQGQQPCLPTPYSLLHAHGTACSYMQLGCYHLASEKGVVQFCLDVMSFHGCYHSASKTGVVQFCLDVMSFHGCYHSASKTGVVQFCLDGVSMMRVCICAGDEDAQELEFRIIDYGHARLARNKALAKLPQAPGLERSYRK